MTEIAAFPIAPGRVRVADFHGATLATGKDLGVVLRYASKHPVDVVELRRLPWGFGVAFHFARGSQLHAHANTLWADWRVALEWLAARHSWGIERVAIDAGLWELASSHWAFKRLQKRGTVVHERRDAR